MVKGVISMPEQVMCANIFTNLVEERSFRQTLYGCLVVLAFLLVVFASEFHASYLRLRAMQAPDVHTLDELDESTNSNPNLSTNHELSIANHELSTNLELELEISSPDSQRQPAFQRDDLLARPLPRCG